MNPLIMCITLHTYTTTTLYNRDIKKRLIDTQQATQTRQREEVKLDSSSNNTNTKNGNGNTVCC